MKFTWFLMRKGDEYEGRMYVPSEEQVADALKFVAIRGDEWVISPTGYRTLRLGDIRENLVIWLFFIKHRTMPMTHDTTIVVERIMLLYSIRIVLPINLRVIIRREIVECGLHTRERLFFLSLIVKLCARARVVAIEEEEKCKFKPIIDLVMLINKLEANLVQKKTNLHQQKYLITY